MSSENPTAVPPIAPFEVHSVHFDFPGGQAIKLRDPVTDRFIGATPEWEAGGRNELVAYVQSTRPEMLVVFLRHVRGPTGRTRSGPTAHRSGSWNAW